MNQATRAPMLATARGAAIPLARMAIQGTLENALAIIELTQVYRNTEKTNIEALYSFPLPLDGVLLQLSVTLDQKRLIGCVTEKAKAERAYEEALADGNTAVMLEQAEPGLFTMNVGNLLAGETCEIRLRYALPLRWEGDTLRLMLPTTVAPRYGNAAEAGIAPHQLPEPDLLVEHRYELSLRVLGELARAQVRSPSHRIVQSTDGDKLVISLEQESTFADRDFILTLNSATPVAASLTFMHDGESTIGHASLRVPEREPSQPLLLKVLIDCSGSMKGDSMILARNAALHVLDQLKPEDRLALAAFGSTVQMGLGGRLIAGDDEKGVAHASTFIGGLNAHLGGTEMRRALEAIFEVGGAAEGVAHGGDVLLITDGETWDRDAIVRAARSSGHRIFVVGVGSAPAELLTRQIAQATGGLSAFVSPKEDVRPLVERYLRQMHVPRITEASLQIPGAQIRWQCPERLQDRLFGGDTLHVYMGLPPHSAPNARLTVTYSDGKVHELQMEGVTATEPDNDRVRVAIAARIQDAVLADTTGHEALLTQLAVTHQLMSPFTNYIFVEQRGEAAAQALPELRKVPSMLAAGWGGTGLTLSAGAPVAAAAAPAPMMARLREGAEFMKKTRGGAPSFLRQMTVRPKLPRQFVEAANAPFGLIDPAKRFVRTLNEPNGLGQQQLPADVMAALQGLVDAGWSEEDVVIAFWLALLKTGLDHHFSRSHRRALLQVSKQRPVQVALVKWLVEALGSTTDDHWNWQPKGPVPAFAPTEHSGA